MLSTFDYLFLPDDEQAVINHVTRQPNLTEGRLIELTGLRRDRLRQLLGQLRQTAYIREELIDGRVVYNSQFRTG